MNTLSPVIVNNDAKELNMHNSTNYSKEFHDYLTTSEGLISSSDNFTEDLSLAIQAAMAFIGFIGNIITFMTLKRSSSMFTETALRLLKNQAVADAIVCVLGSIFVLQPTMWKTGLNETLDLLICQASVHFNYFSIYYFYY